MDIVGDLLPELSQRILLLLNLEEIEIVWNSIEEWKHLLDDSFWRKVCKRINYQEKEGYLTSDIYREYMLESSIHWRAIYKYNQLIESHWSDGNFRFVSIEGDKQYDDINYFDDEILVVTTVLSDTVVNVDLVDLSTGKTSFSFTEENVKRRTRRYQDLMIFLTRKTLKLWNLEAKSWALDVELEKTEVVSERRKRPLDIYKNRLVFLHTSGCIYIVNLETKEVHLNNNRDIDDACFGDNIIILLSKNTNTIITLNLDGEVLTKIDYRGNLEIEDVMTKGGYVIIYYRQVDDEHFRKVSVYTIQQDTQELQEVSSVNELYRLKKFFPNINTILFCNFIHGFFRRKVTYTLWKFATKNGTTVNFGDYQDPLESVAANNCYIFTSDINSMLTMWCLETGKFIRTISDKKLKNVSFKVTENKLAYLNCDKLLCIQNFDFVESRIDVPSKS